MAAFASVDCCLLLAGDQQTAVVVYKAVVADTVFAVAVVVVAFATGFAAGTEVDVVVAVDTAFVAESPVAAVHIVVVCLHEEEE